MPSLRRLSFLPMDGSHQLVRSIDTVVHLSKGIDEKGKPHTHTHTHTRKLYHHSTQPTLFLPLSPDLFEWEIIVGHIKVLESIVGNNLRINFR
jgi:hypothetical protein